MMDGSFLLSFQFLVSILGYLPWQAFQSKVLVLLIKYSFSIIKLTLSVILSGDGSDPAWHCTPDCPCVTIKATTQVSLSPLTEKEFFFPLCPFIWDLFSTHVIFNVAIFCFPIDI